MCCVCMRLRGAGTAARTWMDWGRGEFAHMHACARSVKRAMDGVPPQTTSAGLRSPSRCALYAAASARQSGGAAGKVPGSGSKCQTQPTRCRGGAGGGVKCGSADGWCRTVLMTSADVHPADEEESNRQDIAGRRPLVSALAVVLGSAYRRAAWGLPLPGQNG